MNGLFKKVLMGGHHCQGKAGVITSVLDGVLAIGSAIAVGMIGNHFAKKMDEEIEAEQEETETEAAIEFVDAEVEEEKTVEEETEEPKK